jgi:hypothetical protein
MEDDAEQKAFHEMRKKTYEAFRVSDEELKKKEEDINTFELNQKIITTKGTVIHTFGQIKKYLKTLKQLEKIEDLLDDDDYIYLHNWLSFKLRGEIY